MSADANASDKAREGWMLSSTCRAVEEAGGSAGRDYGLAESMSQTLARLLKRQARQRFGGPDPTGQAMLDNLAQAFAHERLEELAERLVAAAGWAEWLAGVVAPPRAPGLPAYTRDLEIDLEPSEPSIDTHFSARMHGGGEEIVHLRIQKWYQPDLDRHLFHASRKLERKHGRMPRVFVFLMWPPAEGPGMTGRYEDRDERGEVTRVFTYTIKRAWEIEPEEVTQNIGTMLLAPLSRRSRERMPYVVDLIKKGLARSKPDGRTREMVWAAVYWAMGLICDLDEAHRALGDVLPFIHASANYNSAKGHAFLAAYSTAQTEGALRAARTLILRQAARRFGEVPGAAEALAAITGLPELEALAERVLTAADWPSLLAKR